MHIFLLSCSLIHVFSEPYDVIEDPQLSQGDIPQLLQGDESSTSIEVSNLAGKILSDEKKFGLLVSNIRCFFLKIYEYCSCDSDSGIRRFFNSSMEMWHHSSASASICLQTVHIGFSLHVRSSLLSFRLFSLQWRPTEG